MNEPLTRHDLDMVRDWLEERDRRYEARAKAQDDAVSAALASSEKAIDKAEENTRRWQDASNEWRGAMNDREKNFVTRSEWSGAHESLIQRIEGSAKDSTMGTRWLVGLALGTVPAYVAVVILILRG